MINRNPYVNLHHMRELYEQLKHYTDQIQDAKLRAACWKIRDCDDFFTHPASVKPHHAYIGGLWTHTKEVVGYALDFASSFPQTKLDILIAAGLWHDYAKIWDYKRAVFFSDQYSQIPDWSILIEDCGHHKKLYVADKDYKDKVHHITGSTAEFTHHALNAGVERSVIQNVQACIISHHGRKEWGSIKEPQTLEAALLHQADYCSAHFGKTKHQHGELISSPNPFAT